MAATHPRAITMWDFSWLERRWPGAGYEDWDAALRALVDRGYDSVRIDAYPHLVAADANASWTLRPQWTQQAWGAQSPIDVQILPALTDFMAAAAAHGVAVALSTWFREDVEDTRMTLRTPQALADAWIATLHTVDAAGLLDSVLYVDLCNEFPLPVWAPFLTGSTDGDPVLVASEQIQTWMAESLSAIRESFPQLTLGYSFTEDINTLQAADNGTLDIVDVHLWMAGTSDFYDRVGYNFERFDPVGYDNVVSHGLATYLSDKQRYDDAIFQQIDAAADWSRRTGKPLVTTECWSIIDYKDWPGLDWDWVKDLNERALRHAAATGRWVALATSNFCGPQFVGMWRDIDYHRRLTDVIHSATVDPDLAALP